MQQRYSAEYLVTIEDSGSPYVTTLQYGFADTEYGRTENMVFYVQDFERGDYEMETVTAWQPLPKPYKEGKE